MTTTIELQRTQLRIYSDTTQIFELDRQPLSLCDEFAGIWQDFYSSHFSISTEVVFKNFNGGFTDTRIVMIWLRSLAMFAPNIKISKQDSGGFSIISDTIGYNSQPKIGQKI